MSPILMAIIVVTVIGLVGAVILVAASIFMYVPVDERVEKITAALPGANCGACGCAGCADYAKSIVEGGNAIISIIPEHKRKPVVLCQNKDKGAQTRKACSAGCIGCMKCAKACPKEAITVENNLAHIDQDKCVGCQLCVKECPMGVIHVPANE